MRRLSLLTALFALTLIGAACTPPPPGDAGPLVCTGDGLDPAVAPGLTGLGWDPFPNDGGELKTWTRPQGGIGTRINVQISGYDEDARFPGLITEVIGTTAGASCTGDDSSSCAEREACVDDVCRLLIASQANRQFPIECQEDGTLLVPELPIRFRNLFEIAELDGTEAELRITLELPVPDGEAEAPEPLSSSAIVDLSVGEFVRPSWWEDA
jgi:hypothetical protein